MQKGFAMKYQCRSCLENTQYIDIHFDDDHKSLQDKLFVVIFYFRKYARYMKNINVRATYFYEIRALNNHIHNWQCYIGRYP